MPLQGVILMNNYCYFVMLVHSMHLLYVPKAKINMQLEMTTLSNVFYF